MIKAALLLLACASFARAAPAPLYVLVSVDQMRADYVERLSRGSAFGRLMREGAVFTHARHGHVPTETAVGHAALSTGCFPAEHGIVANEWWDRKAGRAVYAAEDSEFGRGSGKLLCPTVGELLKSRYPASLVAAVSGKDRSAILMAGKKADVVLWYDKKSGAFATSGYYGSLPDWAKAWNDAHPVAEAERAAIAATPRLDAMTLDMARLEIDKRGLGDDAIPDFLAVGLSATDYTGHEYGPDSPEMDAQLAALDRGLAEFMESLDRKPGKGRWVLVLSADHGVLPVPESPAGKKLGARRVLDADFASGLESKLIERLGRPDAAGKSWLLGFYQPHVYLNFEMAARLGVERAALIKEATAWLEGQDTVARVYVSGKIAGGPFSAAFRRSDYPERGGDLLVLFKEGVLITDHATGTSHGLPYDYDARVPLLFLGPGIRPGRYDGDVLTIDLAPTLARLMEIEFQRPSPSRALKEALASPAARPR